MQKSLVAAFEREISMTYRILLRSQPNDGYIATALAWPNCEVTAPTREEALAQIRRTIAQMLVEGEFVEVDIPEPVMLTLYQETFGMFRNDPTFPELLAEVENYRRLEDYLMCAPR
jgi:predicted RNase H-like HicB family nuclease